MAIVTVMLCAIFVTVLHFTQQNLEQASVGMMQSLSLSPLPPGQPVQPDGGVRLPYFALTLGPDGELQATAGGYFDLSDSELLQDIAALSVTAPEDTGVLGEYGLRFYRTGDSGGRYIIFTDISSEVQTIETLMRNCLLIGAGSFVIFLFISIRLSRWAVKPVETAWEQQRRFVADASHELKTPLTVILTNAEMLRDSPSGAPLSTDRIADNILVMSRQMRELVERLLELARVECGLSPAVFERVDLSRLVSDAALPFEPVFYEAELDFSAEIEPDIQLRGCPSCLRELVEILLDNARKYSSPRAQVCLRLKRAGARHCLLTVTNHGPGLSPDELTGIFKRFYRADPSRSRDGSYGLGLSIAESVAAAHGGRIWAESENGVNSFHVRLRTAV